MSRPEFKTGQKVVYKGYGVGVIDEIRDTTIAGTSKKFYNISVIETGMKIMVPVDNAVGQGLRKVVNTDTVEEVYKILKSKKATIDNQTWNRRYREYLQKLKTGCVTEIAKVVRDLSCLRTHKELSLGERTMLENAEGLLVKEISVAKDSPEHKVRAELHKLVGLAPVA